MTSILIGMVLTLVPFMLGLGFGMAINNRLGQPPLPAFERQQLRLALRDIADDSPYGSLRNLSAAVGYLALLAVDDREFSSQVLSTVRAMPAEKLFVTPLDKETDFLPDEWLLDEPGI